jgi:hypothetical protein
LSATAVAQAVGRIAIASTVEPVGQLLEPHGCDVHRFDKVE